MAKQPSKVVKTICHMCQNFCGIDAHVKDGKLTKVLGMKEHPTHTICVKAQALADILYSPERITNPMRTQNGIWKKISWSEAYRRIGDRLGDLKEKHGASTLLTHLGYPPVGIHVLKVGKRFSGLYGTPNHTSGASLCFAARLIGHCLTASLTLLPSFFNTSCVVVWGYNPSHSRPRDAASTLSARRRGARLVVVDPRVTSLAKRADLHVQVRPGTDCALALALLNVIVKEGLYDKAFVENWTVGFDKLSEHVKRYTPEAVEEMTWVPARIIRRFAEIYATNKPAVIAQGVSLDHCIHGVQNSRAISTLIAVTGNLDTPGGSVCNVPLNLSNLSVKGAVSLDQAVGAAYPIFGRYIGETNAVPVVDALLTDKPYPVKAIIFDASNPLSNWPNTNKVKKALSRLDLLVVCDLFMTETAKKADIFLPAAHFLEQEMLHDHTFEGLPLIALGSRAVEPPPECREDWRIWSELGRTLGYIHGLPWQSTDELFSELLNPTGITLAQLRQHPGGIFYGDPGLKEKYRETGFFTPSGKVEIFSQKLADAGYPPLPAFDRIREVEGYPLTLIGGSRISAFVHSQHRNIARLRKRVPCPVVEMNLRTAQGLGIADKDRVILESPRGSIQLQASLTEDIHPQVISMQHGWTQANCNVLSDDMERDPISGFPALKTVQCRVRKA